MRKNILTNNKGFSLIELMVVVAIIGILAAIGIPQYARFQAKARTTEAKSTLNAIYIGEASFFSEWNQYSSDLVSLGVQVIGSDLRYTAGWATTACGTLAPAPLEAASAARSQVHLTAVNPATGAGTWRPIIVTNGTTIHAIGGSCTVGSAFTAFAAGDPRQTPAVIGAASDSWSINQQKQLANPVVGL